MLFNSLFFLFVFFPLFLLVYFLSGRKIKNLILLLSSLVFYTWGEGIYVLILLGSIVVDYFAAIIIESGRRKLGLYLSLCFNIGLLFTFKYCDFAFENINALFQFISGDPQYSLDYLNLLLPLGISFFTFQTMSYTMDVYFGKLKASRNIIDFACYVSMFPQLIAGPIVRYSEIRDQLENKAISHENFREGIRRFVEGLAKKVILANSFAKIADDVFNSPVAELSSSWCWIGVLAYTFQIYFDFAGYSDMAIGIGRMLGFKFPENFNYPYISRSIREFWRRWHMTLSRWFRDYLYIPLGGNRTSASRVYFNLFIVFVITGIWHGASWNFLVWGLWHGLFIIIERAGFQKMLNKWPGAVSQFYAFGVVVISWVFFRSPDLAYALDFLQRLFDFSTGNVSRNSYLAFFHVSPETLMLFALSILFSIPSVHFIRKKIESIYDSEQYRKLLFVLNELIYFGLFVLCCIYVSTDSYNPFIYFRF